RGKSTLIVIRRSSEASGQVPRTGIVESHMTFGLNETVSSELGEYLALAFRAAFLFDIKARDRLWFCLLTRRPEIVIGQKRARPRVAISRLGQAGGQKPNVL